MVLPNTRIFSFAYISRDAYSRIRRKLDELEKKTNTEITFNSRLQFFEIKARSQRTCEEVETLIATQLLPILNRSIDKSDYIGGVAPELWDDVAWVFGEKDEKAKSASPMAEDDSLSDDDSDNVDDGDDDDDSYDSDDSFYANLPSARQKKAAKSKAKTEKKDAKSSIMVKKNESHEKFTIAKNIKNLDDLLYGPPMLHMAAADYLQVVGDDTNTECSLNGRQINIFGPTDAAVKDALERFQTIQSLYKRCRKEPTVVPCVHYSKESPRYGLRFCPLHSYKYQSIVCDPKDDSNACILLPVFKDAKGKYIKPSSIVDGDTLNQQMEELTRRFNRASSASPQSSPQSSARSSPQQQQQPSPSWVKPKNGSPKKQPIPLGFHLPERTSTPPGQAPLWGENKYTINTASTSSGNNKKNQLSNSSGWGAAAAAPATNDLFPALPSAPSPTRPTKAPPAKSNQRRVLRLNSQKAPPPSSKNSPTSTMALTREYNLNLIKDALTEGLESINAFRGGITLHAKIGNLLWRNLPEKVQKTIWDMFDVKDLVMKEHKAKPEFNNMAFTSEAIRDNFMGVLPKPYGQSAYYEVHVSARPKPSEPWKPAIMYIESSGAKCYKLDLLQHAITQVDWFSLDRKYDFQMELAVKEIGRPEVKPFVSFVRRIAFRPSRDGATTNHFAYENVPNLLTVNQVLHKDVRKFKLGSEHRLHVTRVEQVATPRDYDSVTPRFVAMKGGGNVWYDIEVSHIPHDSMFKLNQDKQVGVPAPWTVQDVFGDNDSRLEKLVVTMLNLINRLEECTT